MLAALGASPDGADALAGPLGDPKGLPEPWGSVATSAGPSSGVQTHASLPALPDFGQALGGGRGGVPGSLGSAGLACSGLGSAGGGSASAGDECLRALGGLMGGALGIRDSGAAWASGGGSGVERTSAPSPMALPPGSHYVLGGGVGELGSPGLLLSQDLQARSRMPGPRTTLQGCVMKQSGTQLLLMARDLLLCMKRGPEGCT